MAIPTHASAPLSSRSLPAQALLARFPSRLRTPRQQARAQLRAIILYVLAQDTGGAPMTLSRLGALLYLAQMEYMKIEGHPLLLIPFVAHADGPRPVGLRRLVRQLHHQRRLRVAPLPSATAPLSPVPYPF